MGKTPRSGAWSDEETHLLIDLVQELHIIQKVDGNRCRNQQYYQIVADEFAERNINKNWSQISTKFKNLRADYYKILKSSSKSGQGAVSWQFIDKMHSLLSDRPKTQAFYGDLPRVDVLADRFGTSPTADESTTESSVDNMDTADEEGTVTVDAVWMGPPPSLSAASGPATQTGSTSGCGQENGENPNTDPHECNSQQPSTSGSASCEELSQTTEPRTAISRNRKRGDERQKSKKKRSMEGWDTFLNTYKEECEKDRASRKELVASINATLLQSTQILVANRGHQPDQNGYTNNSTGSQ